MGAEERSDLAEVIELRGMLKQRAWADTRPSRWEHPWSETGPEVTGEIGAATTGARLRAADPTPRSISQLASEPTSEPTSGPTSGPTSERTSYEDGVRLLGRRARSSGELRDELLRLQHDSAEVEAVIEEFERSLYLDDLGLARSVTEKLRESRQASRSQIRSKLMARKLPGSVIETALGELDPDDEFELLKSVAADRARKLSGLDRQTAERRLLGFLARRGWSGEVVVRAAREALDGPRQQASGVRFR